MSKLNLPRVDESYTGKLATVTGYGLNWVKIVNYVTVDGDGDYKLKYGKARVLSNEQCQLLYSFRISPNQICAKMSQSAFPSGLCNVSFKSIIKLVIDVTWMSKQRILIR